jgi:hypothetical protein
MANKNIQIEDVSGNQCYPRTLGTLVQNAKGENLGGVEANAQVNKIEQIEVNGNVLNIVDKKVSFSVEEVPVYNIVKQDDAENGYSATYYLTSNGEQVGAKINIPKDMVLQDGSLKICDENDVPVEGYKVGDKYLDMVLANAESSHIYILVNDLVDIYTAGTGIVVDGNQISIDSQVVALKADLANYQTALTAEQLLAVNSGITADKVTQYDGYADGKADKATTLAGYGILDGLTYKEIV